MGDKKIWVKLNGSCLKQDKVTHHHGTIVDIYIIYEIFKNYNADNSPIEKCLFAAVSLTKHVDIDRYKYFGYAIGFDRKWPFSRRSGGTGRNVIIFGADMSSSTKINDSEKNILILVEGPTQILEHTLSTENMYSIDFTEKKQKILFELAL